MSPAPPAPVIVLTAEVPKPPAAIVQEKPPAAIVQDKPAPQEQVPPKAEHNVKTDGLSAPASEDHVPGRISAAL